MKPETWMRWSKENTKKKSEEEGRIQRLTSMKWVARKNPAKKTEE